jgi:uncharacterized protein Yka (UPF0111/DUF47 family)
MTRLPEGADDRVGAAFLLPGAIRRARAAAARLAFVTRVLGLAREHASHPDREPPDLAEAREAVGIDDPALDDAPGEATVVEAGLRLPQAARLHRLAVEALDDLLEPLAVAEAQGRGAGAAPLNDRLQGLLSLLPPIDGDVVPSRYLVAMLDDQEAGLPHLQADLQAALDGLERTLVRQEVAGAHAYGLSEGDRALLLAFMEGLNRTAPLKFDTPGLAVLAARADGALLVQVELVPEEPHMLGLVLEGGAATLRYLDPHLQRVRFFQGLLAAHRVQWGETRAREGHPGEGRETCYLVTGQVALAEEGERERFLEDLGARLVWLVDWNRARKRLRSFVDGPASVELLRWAADAEVGHRAFLQLGAERLVYEAIEAASPTPVRYGQRLDGLLGRDAAVDFLRDVLRATSDGLRRGRSERFIRDEIRADLLGRFETLEHGVLALAGEHAVLVGGLAGAVRDAVGDPVPDEALPRRAAAWEQRADDLVERVRTLARRSPRAKLYARLLGEADDVADDLEEAVFLLTLPAARGDAAPRPALRPLAGLLVAGAEAWRECLAASALVTRGGSREELQAFLESVERLVTLEHQTDDAERQVTALLLGGGVAPHQLLLFSRAAEALERAADALARGALLLRDHFLSEALSG